MLVHVPHSGTYLPPESRATVLLEGAALDDETLLSTDLYTEDLAAWATAAGATLLVNRLSRLVLDPERFPEADREPMEARGRGFLYTRTEDGRALRNPDPEERERTYRELYLPYAAAGEAEVSRLLDEHGRCLVLDMHSFRSALTHDGDAGSGPWPQVCLGTDAFHTPAGVYERLALAFQAEGLSVGENRPYAGCYVPLSRYGTDSRVSAVMVELRRDLYLDEVTGSKGLGFAMTRGRMERACRSGLAGWWG